MDSDSGTKLTGRLNHPEAAVESTLGVVACFRVVAIGEDHQDAVSNEFVHRALVTQDDVDHL
jgi:hypothetical protein